jgi:hypothetical protein
MIRIPKERVQALIVRGSHILSQEVADILADRLFLEEDLRSLRLDHDLLVASNKKLVEELRAALEQT